MLLHAAGQTPSALLIRSLPARMDSTLRHSSAAPAAHGPTATPTAPVHPPAHLSSTLPAAAASRLPSTDAATQSSRHIAVPAPAAGRHALLGKPRTEC